MKKWPSTYLIGKSAGECLYSDSVIGCCLLLKISCHLGLRRAAGFVESLSFFLGEGSYAVPDYSTLCRRQSPVPCKVSRRPYKGKNLDITIDSTD
jgi:hypothetical protein